jgi:hypothetical protein
LLVSQQILSKGKPPESPDHPVVSRYRRWFHAAALHTWSMPIASMRYVLIAQVDEKPPQLLGSHDGQVVGQRAAAPPR